MNMTIARPTATLRRLDQSPVRSLALRLLLLIALSLTAVGLARAQFSGGPFFLLSDASYGSQDTALVRLEALDLSTVAEYGGADVYVYRVDKPIEFLQRQRNLHRVDTRGDYAGPGLANALARVWDNWWGDSRAAWRKLFSQPAREAVLKQAPDVRTHPRAREETPRTSSAEYKPLKGHELVASFRYPVDHARPIAPPAGVKLTGSSSEFIKPIPGNVMIPIGKHKPGLYLVEAMVGAHRANTLVFVSDTIAITKVSARQMLAWVVNRRDGKPSSGARATWTDGVGVLQSGTTDAQGVVTFERAAPEKTYVFGEDSAGGVFIAESFYYDSEIYNTKLYAVTDRPLYRPGDQVFVKFLGRAFKSARESAPISAGELKLQVLDANGFPVATQTVRLTPESGADTSFRLPENAVAGGYELRFTYQDDTYGAAFRVAEYQKPHFEINVLGDKRAWKTGETITGKVQLTYADGKPVPKANAELLVRAQRLTMIEGDLGYSGEFPVKLSAATLTTDANGFAAFSLPAASDPSRYVVSVLATDGAAYRVRATKEILVERSAGSYALRADRGFSAAGETVTFTARQAATAVTEPTASSAPATWEWIRLADRSRSSGKLSGKAAGEAFALKFEQPGTYTVQLRDAAGNVLGGTSHHVSGQGVGAPQGSIEIVFDKTHYNPGEKARALITFPQPVEEALATLERDKVEKTALIAGAASGWVRAHRLSPTQWSAEIPVVADYDPNITFSVVYAKDGEYVFQNHGIKVARPRIDVSVAPDKAVYAPGDTVTLDLVGRIDGKPAADANVTLSVVDEMIYVLAPEIAPDIFEFFYHPRRNNVRTQASLNFVGYDLARPPGGGAMPTRRGTPERAIKVLERPRRDETDTALWLPALKLDREGKARVSFKMPDSLTRWRVTVRAADRDGTVGQQATHVRSDKAFYLKWASPNWLRSQDEPSAAVAIFNQGTSDASIELNVTGAGLKRTDKLTAKPGANFVRLPVKITQGDAKLQLQLSAAGKPVDALEVALDPVPVSWSSPRVVRVPFNGEEAALALPADASAVRVQLMDSAAAQFRRVIDDLLDYPYGCVEQTASRLVPYSIALQSLAAGDERMRESLVQRLHSHRFRLAQLAGPQATFGWWSAPIAGDGKDTDPLLTAYAYFADWHATRALKLDLPPEHWQRLLTVYRKQGADLPPLHRALMLYWMHEIGMPVGSLAAALNEELDRTAASYATSAGPQLVSAVLATPEPTLSHALARVLGAHLSPAGNAAAPDAAVERLKRARLPLADALLMMTKRLPVSDAGDVLDRVRADMPTIDRALTLVWLQRALTGTGLGSGGGAASAASGGAPQRAEPGAPPALAGPWTSRTTQLGERVFQWPAGQPLPKSLKLTAASNTNTVAMVQYESRDPEKSSLAVTIERRLYRLRKLDPAAPAKPAANASQPDSQPQRGQAPQELVARAAEFSLEPVGADEPLRTDELYLDEVVLTPTSKSPARFGIVEVPLPPGANADRSTWGISLRNAGAQAVEPLERARFVDSPRGYAVPIERLETPVTVRHLVRVAQAGTFALPPARYYRMYEPEQKAFEERHRARVVVR